jgi:hypothetical protein
MVDSEAGGIETGSVTMVNSEAGMETGGKVEAGVSVGSKVRGRKVSCPSEPGISQCKSSSKGSKLSDFARAPIYY